MNIYRDLFHWWLAVIAVAIKWAQLYWKLCISHVFYAPNHFPLKSERLKTMLCIFPKDFSQVSSQEYFPSGNFPILQFPKRQLPKSVLAAKLGPPVCSVRSAQTSAYPSRRPHCSLRRLRWSNLTFGKLPPGKLSLGKSPLGKSIRECTQHHKDNMF